LDISGFPIKLDILSLLFSNQDGVLEVYVDYNYKFVLARLEEEVLNIAEENVDPVLGV
jgi:hypothetical protein